MKILIILIDGLGDLAIPDLHNQTPLEYLHLPNLTMLAKFGINGLMDPVAPGLACGSDTAHLSLFGYNPFECYRGRGSFETMGTGLDMLPGDIAFKANFANWNPHDNIVVSRRADRHFEAEGQQLCNDLNGLSLPDFPEIEVSFKYATEHRCGIRLRGPGLTDQITGTDPLKDGRELLQSEPVVMNPDSIRTAKIVNQLSHEIHKILSSHPINSERREKGKTPANIILLRGCGSRIDVETFQSKYNRKGFMIAPTCIIAGLGKTIGIDVISVEGATGDYSTDLSAKATKASELIQDEKYDFGFIHIKAVDDVGHDKSLSLKLEFLVKIDQMIGQFIESLNMNLLLCVTGDHSTPVSYGDHSCDPVPFVACKVPCQSQAWTDSVEAFNEIDCSSGSLGRFLGISVMSILQNLSSQCESERL